MAKPPPSNRPEARTPRGFQDIDPARIRAEARMLGTIREVYESYGFEPLETPAIEYTDALGKFLPDQDRPNEGVFSFQDDDEQWLSLRYDLTAPLARYVAEGLKQQTLSLPFRRYATGPVWRNEKPGPGRFRQFTQFDADTVGTESVAADAEICMLAADTMEQLGVARGQYVIKVSNRKILDGILETVGLGGPENAGRRLTVLRAIDKLDRLGMEGVRQLLGEGRKDESGDFTKGAGLDAVANAAIREAISPSPNVLKVEPAKITITGQPVGLTLASPIRSDNHVYLLNRYQNFPDSPTYRQGLDELQQMADLLEASGYGADRVRMDASSTTPARCSRRS
jgi:histidyl-tRNA synthetase